MKAMASIQVKLYPTVFTRQDKISIYHAIKVFIKLAAKYFGKILFKQTNLENMY